jgi:hypothetical protein
VYVYIHPSCTIIFIIIIVTIIIRRRPVDPEYPFMPDEIVDVFDSNTDFRRYGMISRA